MSDTILQAKPGSGNMPRVVLDTDAFNEIDDQFAIAYLVRAADKAETEAIYAAPFANQNASTAAEGMEKSFDEIGRVLERLGNPGIATFRGSEQFLDAAKSDGKEAPEPVESAAAADLVERSLSATHSDRLTVVAIGALTNVASALLMEPEIAERCTVVWLGGHAQSWPHNEEFNMQGDIPAAQVVFDSGVPLYVVPCQGVASHLHISRAELAQHTSADNPTSAFLRERFGGMVPKEGVHSKVIWDIAAVAWMVLPESVKSVQCATPRVASDGSYIRDPRRHQSRFAYDLDRDAIFADLFSRLGGDV